MHVEETVRVKQYEYLVLLEKVVVVVGCGYLSLEQSHYDYHLICTFPLQDFITGFVGYKRICTSEKTVFNCDLCLGSTYLRLIAKILHTWLGLDLGD